MLREIDSVPQTLEAEARLLAALMVRSEHVPACRAACPPERFYKLGHRLIYQAILDRHEAGEDAGLPGVKATLQERDQLERAGGVVYLSGLLDGESLHFLAPRYARLVTEAWAKREAMAGASSVLAEASRGAAIGDVVTMLEGVRAKLQEAGGVDTLRAWPQVQASIVERLTAIYERQESPAIASGFTALDGMLVGLRPKDLIVLAGRPGSGKSTLAMDVALKLALDARGVYVVSLEMEADMVQSRMVCAQVELSHHLLMRGLAPAPRFDRFCEEMERLDKLPIWYDDAGRSTVPQIEAHARSIQADHDLSLIVVDYLQLLEGVGGKRNDNRQAEVAQISRHLKQMAMVLNVPVLALSQLNRKSEDRSDGRPRLSDLRESGAIEQDADVVLLLYRADQYRSDDKADGSAEVIIAKQRSGPVGQVALRFESYVPRFIDPPAEYD